MIVLFQSENRNIEMIATIAGNKLQKKEKEMDI